MGQWTSLRFARLRKEATPDPRKPEGNEGKGLPAFYYVINVAMRL